MLLLNNGTGIKKQSSMNDFNTSYVVIKPDYEIVDDTSLSNFNTSYVVIKP